MIRKFGILFALALAFNSEAALKVASAPAKNSKAVSSALKTAVEGLDKISVAFNSKPPGAKRIDDLLVAYEHFMDRKLGAQERDFLKKELTGVGAMPRFEIQKDQVHVFRMAGKAKEVLVTVDVVDAQKNIFRYNGKSFQLNSAMPLQDNLQVILRGIKSQTASR